MAEIVEKQFAERDKKVGSPSTSRIPMSPTLSGTYRFGEISPFFLFYGVGDDKVQLQCKHSLRSYTLSAPLMSDIRMHRELFQVPYQAILPRTWDLIYSQPSIGADTPENANCLYDLYDITERFLGDIILNYGALDLTDDAKARLGFNLYMLHAAVLRTMVSRGSLPAALGCNLWTWCEDADSYIEQWMDSVASWYNGNIDYLEFRHLVNGSMVSDIIAGGASHPSMSLRQAFEMFCDDPSNCLWYPSDGASFWTNAMVPTLINLDYRSPSATEKTLNASAAIAYQLICSHFFTNDKVDYVFSADMYRNYIHSLLTAIDPSNSYHYFSYNGMNIEYDYLSGYSISQAFVDLHDSGSAGIAITTSTGIVPYAPYYALLTAIFGFKRSLRFVDYFTGSRTRPLSTGSISVSNSDGTIDALSVAKGISYSRFFNAVNRIPRQIEQYLRGIFGVDEVKRDYHNPLWLAAMQDSVFGDETDNTGAAQVSQKVSTTTNLRSTGSQFAFDIRLDRPSVLLGVVYFDIPRCYTRGVDRFWLHRTRYDMFNPYLQYIGDQEVKTCELYMPSGGSTFGYTNRHQEYKAIPNRAFGGFLSEALPGWEFLADESYKSIQKYGRISPEYIRSRPSELDQFYISLSGYSPANYFHFAIKWTNVLETNRPMIVAPNIL